MDDRTKTLDRAYDGADTRLADVEKAAPAQEEPSTQNSSLDGDTSSKSAFKSLGLLDRFLAVWILLAMIIGVLLGNFVPETGPALDKGKFVGVSIPIGQYQHFKYYLQTED
jgi:ACR3 family arsenite transporter